MHSHVILLPLWKRNIIVSKKDDITESTAPHSRVLDHNSKIRLQCDYKSSCNFQVNGGRRVGGGGGEKRKRMTMTYWHLWINAKMTAWKTTLQILRKKKKKFANKIKIFYYEQLWKRQFAYFIPWKKKFSSK